jgi:hypothetical protein
MSTAYSVKLGGVTDYDAKNFRDKKFKFILNHFNADPTLKYEKGGPVNFPLTFNVLLYDIIFDEKTKMQRTIRYIPGEKSIYVDEQTPDNEKSAPKKMVHAEFVKGEFTVEGYNTTLIDFMMKSNFNGSNPNRIAGKRLLYRLLDTSLGMKLMMDKDKKVDEAKHWCYTGDWDQVAAYAQALGLNMGDDPSQIRFHMRQLVDKDVEKFTEGMNNAGVRRKYFILQAIEQGHLTVNNNDGTVSWASGGTITTSPAGKNPVDHFVDSTFSQAGEAIFRNVMTFLRPQARVETVIEPTLAPAPKHNPKKDILPTNPNAPSDGRIEEIIHEAISNGIIEQAGPWYSWADQKVKGSEAMKEAVKTSAEVLAYLEAEIMKKNS